MKITGLQKTTLLDYPGHVAATVFLGGCNFRCPFCHNMDIVEASALNAELTPAMDDSEVTDFLKKRQGILEGVCITGGEPTMYKELPEFIGKIKELGGYLVKLDTNGTNPEMLKKLIDDKLIDYVAMDIKAPIDKYAKVAGLDKLHMDDAAVSKLTDNVIKSVNILKTSDIDYEFRTTVVKEYHNTEDFVKIGELVKGAKKYYLQAFNDSDYVPDHSLNTPDKDMLTDALNIMKSYAEITQIRGVD